MKIKRMNYQHLKASHVDPCGQAIGLTELDRICLDGLARGLFMNDIARLVNKSYMATYMHIKRLRERVGVSSIAQLMFWWGSNPVINRQAQKEGVAFHPGSASYPSLPTPADRTANP